MFAACLRALLLISRTSPRFVPYSPSILATGAAEHLRGGGAALKPLHVAH
jgi:hypothetical protein